MPSLLDGGVLADKGFAEPTTLLHLASSIIMPHDICQLGHDYSAKAHFSLLGPKRRANLSVLGTQL